MGISAASTLEKTTGDTFRWRHMFPRIAGYFGMARAPSDHMPSQEANRDERPRLRGHRCPVRHRRRPCNRIQGIVGGHGDEEKQIRGTASG